MISKIKIMRLLWISVILALLFAMCSEKPEKIMNHSALSTTLFLNDISQRVEFELDIPEMDATTIDLKIIDISGSVVSKERFEVRFEEGRRWIETSLYLASKNGTNKDENWNPPLIINIYGSYKVIFSNNDILLATKEFEYGHKIGVEFVRFKD